MILVLSSTDLREERRVRRDHYWDRHTLLYIYTEYFRLSPSPDIRLLLWQGITQLDSFD